jgi:hypothetical protein
MPRKATIRLSLRLDSRTDAELSALVDYFADHLGTSNPSQVIRTAIRELYRKHEAELASKGTP